MHLTPGFGRRKLRYRVQKVLTKFHKAPLPVSDASTCQYSDFNSIVENRFESLSEFSKIFDVG